MAEKMSEKIKKVKNVAGDLAERLSEFTKKSLSEKLGIISDSWKKYYPDIFTERRFFEKIMGEYRYKKVDGWLHTGDISDNFKGVDFYKGAEIEGIIDASTAVSMKTTTVKDVNAWLISKPIQDNIKFLEEGLDDTKGIISNNKKMIISEAEIHIYMPKENITPELKATWMDKLKISNPNIKFEINALEDFVK